MSYNNRYGPRNSRRYNNPRPFMPAAELNMGRQQDNFSSQMGPPQQVQNVQFNKPQPLSQTFRKPSPERPQLPTTPQPDESTDGTDTPVGDGSPSRPTWMKSKLQGVKKVSNKERRRRQNETLRRLLTPKNALMVLNEIMPGEQVASQFKVEPVTDDAQYYRPNTHSFCADLTLHGNNYKGYGENKLTARNAAAEQAIRDLMLQRMARLLAGGDAGGDAAAEAEAEPDEALPMIQLASYALHKLFAEWEFAGHKVPRLRAAPAPEHAAEARRRALPAAAPAMHPCMLLTYMRAQLEYRELPPEGDCQQNLVFGMAVDVDGQSYVGRAQNKKEARKLAAKAACEALFDVKFDNIN